MASGIVLAATAGIAVTYLTWTFASRNGDGPWFGLLLGVLVTTGLALRALGL